MISNEQVQAIRGGTAVDRNGDKVGSVGEVYLDDQSGQPAWVTVNTGLFGTSETFVPLRDATVDGDTVRLPYEKDLIKDAPRVNADQHLDVEQEQELYRHYSLTQDSGQGGQNKGTSGSQESNRSNTAAAGTAAAGTAAAGVTGRGRDTEVNRAGSVGVADRTATDRTSGFAGTGNAGGAGERSATGTSGLSAEALKNGLVRHEERLNVGTERREVGKVRVRKYVTTEEETIKVPVRREEVRLNRESMEAREVTAADLDANAFADLDHEITLHEEVPVVSKQVFAVERINFGTELIEEEKNVTDSVRREHFEIEGADGKGFTQNERRDTK